MNAKAVLFDLNEPKKMRFNVAMLSAHMTKQDIRKFMVFTPQAYSQLPPFLILLLMQTEVCTR